LYNNLQGGVAKHRYTNEPAVVDDLRAHGWLLEGEAQTMVFACTAQ
jgi:hypothetical protein